MCGGSGGVGGGERLFLIACLQLSGGYDLGGLIKAKGNRAAQVYRAGIPCKFHGRPEHYESDMLLIKNVLNIYAAQRSGCMGRGWGGGTGRSLVGLCLWDLALGSVSVLCVLCVLVTLQGYSL